MTDLMIKMAQAAAEDEMLYASYIHRYALKEEISWQEVAKHLQIDMAQLAKLALCRLPQPSMLMGEVMQVADYVAMERSALKAFLDEVEGRPSVLKSEKTPRRWNHQALVGSNNVGKGVAVMFSNKRIWAIGVVILVLLIGAFVLAQPDEGAATLVVFTGQATIVQVDTGLLASGRKEIVAEAGEVLTVVTGDTITLAADATGQIRLLDGSTVDLAANTSVDVTELVITDDSYRVRLRMLAGRTVSRVVTVLGVTDRFEISTPSSTASVRGTVFTVEVLSGLESFIACDEGIVRVTMGDQMVDVVAGMMVTAVVNQPLQVQPQESQAPAPQPTDEGQAPEAGQLTATPAPTSLTTPTATTTATTMATATPTASGTTMATTVGTSSATATTMATTVNSSAATATTMATAMATVATTAVPTTASLAPTSTSIPPTAPSLPATDTPESQVTLCHRPPGNPDNGQTITVGSGAVQAHLDHGDTLGSCPQPTNPPPPPTNTPLPPPPPTNTPLPPPLPTNTPLPPPPPTNTPQPPPTDTPEPSLVTICHIPPGNPNNAQTIMVSSEEVQGHLDHGDTLGACP